MMQLQHQKHFTGPASIRTITLLLLRPTSFIKRISISLLLISIIIFSSLNNVHGASPVIGILSQPAFEFTSSNNKNDNNNGQERQQQEQQFYIAASYVKWLELGGARSIPIPYDASKELVDEIFEQINGVLFPGGAAALPPTAVYIWKKAMHANQKNNGDFFPIWGTCLGFEFLLMLASSNPFILEGNFNAENISLPLNQVQQQQLYHSTYISQIVQEFNITMNNHVFGISPTTFQQHESLSKYWNITSTNYDLNNKEFVSTIEPKQPDKFPIYGVQYHPEKNTFEYATYPHTNIPYEAINHSPEAIALSVHLATFFVSLARTNQANGIHKYNRPDTFPLVYDYPMKTSTKFEQVFLIPPMEKNFELMV